MNPETLEKIKNEAEKLVKILREEGHPHMKIIIDSSVVEVVEGIGVEIIK